ncbi:MAG TPA: peptidoglycan-binding protein [Beijerinckiaceae bacterium]|nr:peptidoglycan-binding protein [Beijerinckiaceae bacterium]
MALVDQSGIVGKVRDRRISIELERLLERAAEAAGVDVVRVTSGGQPGTTGKSVGSTRHNGGRAADLQLVVDGRTLEFTDEDGGDTVEAFVTAAAALGANGIGAGVAYMGSRTLHVGFGETPDDHRRIVWGYKGKSKNAPRWLREAAERGWDNPSIIDELSNGTKHSHQHDGEEEEERGGLHREEPPPRRRHGWRDPDFSEMGGGVHDASIRLPDFGPLFPNANPEVMAELRDNGARALARYGILQSERRFAFFMAQLAHESGGFRTLQEGLRYSANRLMAVWPKRFPTAALASAYAGNEQKLANMVYGGRNGNGPEPTGDGYRYRGRGLIQLTFRDNYREVGRIVDLDLERNPDLAADPEHVWTVACGYWTMRKLNRYADNNDFLALTKTINGGINGLADRQKHLARVSQFLARVGFTPVGEEAAAPYSTGRSGSGGGSMHRDDIDLNSDDLHFGMPKNPHVESIQKQLNALGFYLGAEDGIFGKNTRAQVMAFQAEHGLATTGIVDAAFRSVLTSASRRTVEGPRQGADEKSMIRDRSRIVYETSWNRLFGKVFAGIGGVGLLNSGVMNTVGGSLGSAGATAKTVVANPAQTMGQIREVLQHATGANGTSPQVALDVVRDILAKQNEVALSASDAIQLAARIRDAIGLVKTTGAEHAQSAQAAVDIIRNLVGKKAEPAASAAQNIFELWAKNAGGGNVSAIADVLGQLAGTLLPGATGSAVTLGLGALSWLISNRVISSRIADHRSGKHLGR